MCATISHGSNRERDVPGSAFELGGVRFRYDMAISWRACVDCRAWQCGDHRQRAPDKTTRERRRLCLCHHRSIVGRVDRCVDQPDDAKFRHYKPLGKNVV